MTTIAASPLTDALQGLIDARLDTIDRMLLGRVNRQDRLAIVREVESQVFDLLRGRDAGSLDRDDVLAVLATLDPPEAYLPDDDSPAGVRPLRAAAPPRAIPARAVAPAGRGGQAGGILGMVAATLAALSYPLAELFQSEIFLLGSMGLALITGILAIVFSGRARLRDAWAIVGLITGTMALTIFIVLGIVLLFKVVLHDLGTV